MRLFSFALLASTAIASEVFTSSTPSTQTQSPAQPISISASQPTPTTLSTSTLPRQKLEVRQDDVTSATTTAASQADAATTYWIESAVTVGTVVTTTYVEVTYSQSFASVPDQGSTAGSGTIGLGTATSTATSTSSSDDTEDEKTSGASASAAGVVGVVAGLAMVAGGLLVV